MDKIYAVLNDKMLFSKTLLNLLKGHHVEYIQAISSDHTGHLEVIRNIIEYYNNDVDLYDLFANPQPLAPIINIATNHYNSNTRIDYLFSVLKIKNICFELMLIESGIDRQEVITFAHNMHKIYNVYEIIVTGKWFQNTADKYHQHLDKTKGEFKQLNTRYHAVLNQLPYPVLLTDDNGYVTDINKAARKYFSLIDTNDTPIYLLDLLDYHFISFQAFADSYKNGETKLLHMLNGEIYTNSFVKLNKKAYMYTLMPASEKDIRNSQSKAEQLSLLTQSERIIYTMVQEGLTSKQIAVELCISEETVKTHRRNTRRKLRL